MTVIPILMPHQENSRPTKTKAGAEVWLIRHGQTEWSVTGQHSGRRDLPLTSTGEFEAQQVARILNGRKFDLVLCSPLQRAARTCGIAGYDSAASIEPDVQEWDYGDCMGKTELQVREEFFGLDDLGWTSSTR